MTHGNNETCPDCNGAGEVFTHADDCTDDLCALNGDMHSCSGKVEPCGACGVTEVRSVLSATSGGTR